MKQYIKFVEKLNTVFMGVSVVLLIVVMIASILQVVTRTLFNNPMVGTEEVARFAFIWVSFLGSAIGVSKFTHPTVDMLNNALKGNTKRMHLILTQIFIMAFGVVLLIHGRRITEVVVKQLSPTLRISMAYIYAACPVGGIGIILNALAVIFDQITGITEGEVKV
ncbi:MAG: TRAP transporter small permease [Stomatobaculum sp.]|nr:TRAP transporter small permease [Stomatobaculum sp.]